MQTQTWLIQLLLSFSSFSLIRLNPGGLEAKYKFHFYNFIFPAKYDVTVYDTWLALLSTMLCYLFPFPIPCPLHQTVSARPAHCVTLLLRQKGVYGLKEIATFALGKYCCLLWNCLSNGSWKNVATSRWRVVEIELGMEGKAVFQRLFVCCFCWLSVLFKYKSEEECLI